MTNGGFDDQHDRTNAEFQQAQRDERDAEQRAAVEAEQTERKAMEEANKPKDMS